MREPVYPEKSRLAAVIYNLLNPVPYGCFIAALIFDIIYIYSTDVMWGKSASWLILFGLLFAIIPRLINLFQVWVGAAWPQLSAVKIHFWLNLLAIVAAILNSFVHSRDAYAIAPQNVIWSAITVACLVVANITLTLGRARESHHE